MKALEPLHTAEMKTGGKSVMIPPEPSQESPRDNAVQPELRAGLCLLLLPARDSQKPQVEATPSFSQLKNFSCPDTE